LKRSGTFAKLQVMVGTVELVVLHTLLRGWSRPSLEPRHEIGEAMWRQTRGQDSTLELSC
jgi:hypothetical protein